MEETIWERMINVWDHDRHSSSAVLHAELAIILDEYLKSVLSSQKLHYKGLNTCLFPLQFRFEKHNIKKDIFTYSFSNYEILELIKTIPEYYMKKNHVKVWDIEFLTAL